MSDLYKELDLAMRNRQTALNGIERWQSKLREAEAELETVAAKLAANAGTVVPPAEAVPTPGEAGFGAAEVGASFEQAPAEPGALAPDYAESAE